MNLALESLQNFFLIGLEIYQFLLLLYIIASWFGGLPRNAIGEFLHGIINPLLMMCQKIPHRVWMLDLSPIYAFIFLGFLKFCVLVLF